MSSVDENLEIVRQIDRAWNERDWSSFGRLHAEDVFVRFSNPKGITGRVAHLAEAQNFLSAFPDHQIDFPYLYLFGEGDLVCSVFKSSGVQSGPWKLPDGRLIPTTGKRLEMEMNIVSRVLDGEVAEKIVSYDMLGLLTRLGVIKLTEGTVKAA
ncbi:MAG: ester cyclase [Nitrospirae bacterium]|nr:ester cyclase [Candidatus Manganitrophaceae bacterium]